MKPKKQLAPQPVERDIRICFAIAWFRTEAEAEAYAAANRSTYNGGWYHGVATGRDPSWDKTDADGNRLYASTY